MVSVKASKESSEKSLNSQPRMAGKKERHEQPLRSALEDIKASPCSETYPQKLDQNEKDERKKSERRSASTRELSL